MLRCEDISLYAGKKHLFDLESLDLSGGLYALVGRNGAGKSTFLQAILGSAPLTLGQIFIDELNVSEIKPAQLARKVSLVRTKPSLFGDLSVKDILLLGRLPYQNVFAKTTAEDKAIVNEIVDYLNLDEYLESSYHALSDGEKQMVLVARALIQDTPIVLLDEPTAFLDLVNRKELLNHLLRLASEKNKLILFSTHHIAELDELVDGVLLIHENSMHLLEQKEAYKEQIFRAFDLI
jgi:iron complex transport system ATP-binding protein